jgi:hypothetical protein
MNDETTTLDQADEDILTPTVSDEAIEAVAGIERMTVPPSPDTRCCPASWYCTLPGRCLH